MTTQKGFATALWLAIAAIVVIAGGTYLYMNPGTFGDAGDTAGDEANAPADGTDASGSFTVEELLARGQNVTCTFAFDGGDSSTTGTVFVADGKLRGDYATVAGGQTFNSHVIVRDDAANIWVDGMGEGFTSKLAGQVTTGGGSAAPDINSRLDYTCVPWTAEDAKFVLPTDVTFRAVATPTAS